MHHRARRFVSDSECLFCRSGHNWRHGHASQPLSALCHGSNPRLRPQRRGRSQTGALLCLLYSWFVNVAILMVAASAFHSNGNTTVATLEDAYVLLSPVLGKTAGSTLFAVALLASAQNATLTGTLTGQIVMEGFTTFHISPVVRRTATRLLAIIPAVIAVAIGGDGAAIYLLVVSQSVPVFCFALYNFSSRPHFEFTGQDGGVCQPSLANRCCLHQWGSHRQA